MANKKIQVPALVEFKFGGKEREKEAENNKGNAEKYNQLIRDQLEN